VARLFDQVRRLAQSGVAVLFISHRIDEVFEIADRVTVLRDGRLISSRPKDETNAQQSIQDMVGRDLSEFFARSERSAGDVVLTIEDFGKEGIFTGVNFELRRGEILGLAGLVGAGRTDIALALFGIAAPDRGVVKLNGRPISIGSPQEAMRNGIAYLSEDRRRLGLSLPQSITANVTLATLRNYAARTGLLDSNAERATADRFRKKLRIRASSVDTPVEQLSGGNQQKTMLAKWLNTEPTVLILDEPTRGIDVGAKAEVHQIIDTLAQSGIAIILISSDLPEVIAMSDRVLVMREGRQVGMFAASEATEERIVSAAMGAG
jgi:rhamnose transport system ATP-binding protein